MEDDFKKLVAENIAKCRKRSGMTQAELAEKLNYSDKSVSKWERGEGLPDIYVLAQMADIFQIRVDDLLRKNPPEPERIPSRIYVTAIAAGMPWLVAAIIYLMLRLFAPDFGKAWMAFMFAVPSSLIVLTVFLILWWGHLLQCLSVSALIWTMALSVFFMVSRDGMGGVFILAGVLQVLAVLWFLLSSRRAKKRT